MKTKMLILVVIAVMTAAGCVPNPYDGGAGDGVDCRFDGFCDESCAGDTDCAGQSVESCNDPPDEFGRILDVPQLAQQCQNWCWAATIEMVVEYYGGVSNQCLMATAKAGGNQGECCQIGCQGICDTPAQFGEMAAFLSVQGISGELVNRALSEEEVQRELFNGRPIIVSYASSFTGHVVIVSGYTLPNVNGTQGAIYEVIDPFFGPTAVNYGQLVFGYQNGQARWIATFASLTDGRGCR